ncbi:MAG TPA: aspartate--tRNA ligase [Candidatus Pacearchaeota archaeon]|nr:aspartate--tRNA ligase [Candidatus Paceibacterota bacterium]HOK00690.1 aspartate--tRNA ligase [Candidatus Pacearchaeota archaeon]HOL90438.1 aspartate--tRNA ligase [Candidatus Pacearchaeota archaeon]
MKRILSNEIINYIGKEVKVCGWVNSIRVHGKIIFIDLRDISGILQVVFDYKNQEIYKIAEKVKPESVIELKGIINERPKNMINLKIKTGEVELLAKEIKILSKAETLPFSVEGDGYDINEEKRMKYRYLDLRRERMKRNLKTRFEVISFMRDFLKKEGFIEVETPILTKSTPEGARDFLVPSRLEKGKFYALPQSPQQYKQLLMVAGLEKYFQIARCFRDEDPRADRQAEFTQLDIETSFYSQEEILDLIERLYISLVKELFPEKKIQKIPFPRLTYKEVMEKYNSDKPDLRMDKNSKDELAFAFIVDFPMFVWSEEEKRWDAVHHPFTRPQTDNIKEIKKNPENILAYQYDFVLNGYEIGGGSLRTYNPEVLEAVFEVMGHKKDEIKEKFGHLLKAFEYGVPPHGGIAPGIDRFLSIVLNEPNIREVIAFPKTGDSRDLMMGAPDKVDEKQLKELGLEIKGIKDKDKKDKKKKEKK